MHEYPSILKGTSDEARGQAFSSRVMDVSAFLVRLGDLVPIPLTQPPFRVAYHDACHLANAQGIRDEPRELLRMIPGLELVEIADSHLCCGSAGTYNIEQPEVAHSLGKLKADNVVATNATIVASGNIGCMTQLAIHLKRSGSKIQVRHTMQVIRDAYVRAEV